MDTAVDDELERQLLGELALAGREQLDKMGVYSVMSRLYLAIMGVEAFWTVHPERRQAYQS